MALAASAPPPPFPASALASLPASDLRLLWLRASRNAAAASAVLASSTSHPRVEASHNSALASRVADVFQEGVPTCVQRALRNGQTPTCAAHAQARAQLESAMEKMGDVSEEVSRRAGASQVHAETTEALDWRLCEQAIAYTALSERLERAMEVRRHVVTATLAGEWQSTPSDTCVWALGEGKWAWNEL
ncbi:hypothetical protein NFJ02_21g46420 [Pycnococcus provasolii]